MEVDAFCGVGAEVGLAAENEKVSVPMGGDAAAWAKARLPAEAFCARSVASDKLAASSVPPPSPALSRAGRVAVSSFLVVVLSASVGADNGIGWPSETRGFAWSGDACVGSPNMHFSGAPDAAQAVRPACSRLALRTPASRSMRESIDSCPPTAAISRAVTPLTVASRSAPCARSSCASRSWLHAAACMRGVQPSWSRESTLTPLSRRRHTQRAEPCTTASASGERPAAASATSAAPPAWSSASSTSSWSRAAACASGVRPSVGCAQFTDAPSASAARTPTTSPWREAHQRRAAAAAIASLELRPRDASRSHGPLQW
eukprot:scaffold70702_cov24-Tisochrysis_lutea.AAC.3